MPLREFYQQTNKYIKINGIDSIENISNQIFNLLDNKETAL
jgi:hypothetical protein